MTPRDAERTWTHAVSRRDGSRNRCGRSGRRARPTKAVICPDCRESLATDARDLVRIVADLPKILPRVSIGIEPAWGDWRLARVYALTDAGLLWFWPDRSVGGSRVWCGDSKGVNGASIVEGLGQGARSAFEDWREQSKRVLGDLAGLIDGLASMEQSDGTKAVTD